MDITSRSEKHYKEVPDVEFTSSKVNCGMLRRACQAHLPKLLVTILLVDMANDGLIHQRMRSVGLLRIVIPCSMVNSTICTSFVLVVLRARS